MAKKDENWVGTNWTGMEPAPPPPPQREVSGAGFGGGMFDESTAPSPTTQIPGWQAPQTAAAGIGDTGSTPARLPNQTMEAIYTDKARDKISKKEAELRDQGAFSPGTPAGSIPLIGSNNTGYQLIAEEPSGGGKGIGENPMDKNFADIQNRLTQLSRSIVPTKGGTAMDTYMDNIDTFTEMKNLKGMLPTVGALTTQGQGIEKQKLVGEQAQALQGMKQENEAGETASKIAMNKAHASMYNAISQQGKPEPLELQAQKAWDKDLADSIKDSGIMAQIATMKGPDADKAIAQFASNHEKLMASLGRKKPNFDTNRAKAIAAEKAKRGLQ